MTDRRRNVLILVLVGALLAAAIAVVATKPTRLGLDLKGGVELVYQAKPTNGQQLGAESVTRAIDIMRQRVDALGVAEPEIQQSGANQIVVSLPNVTRRPRGSSGPPRSCSSTTGRRTSSGRTASRPRRISRSPAARARAARAG